jgi:hypothetical protein
MQSKETRDALAILAKAGVSEATPEEYAKEAGATRLTYGLGGLGAKAKRGLWLRKKRSDGSLRARRGAVSILAGEG